MTSKDIDARTIRDFGEQWTRHPEIDPAYDSSPEMLADVLGPDFPASALRGAVVAEIGAGMGRIVKMLIEAGVAHVHALEPSAAVEALWRNTAPWADRVSILECRGDELPSEPKLDAVLSIGVIHHIVDPAPVMAAALAALKPGGRVLIWLYGHEGNGLYLAVVLPFRRLSSRLPAWALDALSHLGVWLLQPYLLACRAVPRLPLGRYMRDVFGRCSYETRRMVIYDQLNPAYAKYYKKDEAVALLATAGFVDIRAYHRHGYSWTVVGAKPAA